MMPAWIPSEGYGRGGFDANERDLTGGAFPMFYDLPIFNTAMTESLGKGAPWALANAPTGKNSMCNMCNAGGTWYYLSSSGSMVTGWQLLGGTWYHFAPSGAWIG